MEGTHIPHVPPAPGIPSHLAEQAEQLRRAGMTAGIPIVIQIDERALAQLRAVQAPLPYGHELARFAGKAAVATTIALGGALAYTYLTRPEVAGV